MHSPLMSRPSLLAARDEQQAQKGGNSCKKSKLRQHSTYWRQRVAICEAKPVRLAAACLNCLRGDCRALHSMQDKAGAEFPNLACVGGLHRVLAGMFVMVSGRLCNLRPGKICTPSSPMTILAQRRHSTSVAGPPVPGAENPHFRPLEQVHRQLHSELLRVQSTRPAAPLQVTLPL